MKKVLITGADGFIGRHLTEALLKAGYTVYCIVYPGNEISGTTHEKLYIYSIDLNDILNHVNDFPKSIDVMYHLAWNGVKPQERNNFDVQMTNIELTLNCMKFANAIGVKKIIFAGSTNEYLYSGKPLNKYALPSPDNTYGATKIALRYLCSDFAVRNNIQFIYTIITGIYSEYRKDDNVIFYTINKLLNGQSPSLTKLEQLWDYVHIDDVTRALILIGEKGKNLAVYAIGHGDNWPLSDYIKIIHEKIDPSLPLGIGEIPYSSTRLPNSCIDLTDLKNDTGFEPNISFEEGITKVINSLKKDVDNDE